MGVAVQIGDPADEIEIATIAVQVAGDHHLLARLAAQYHDVAIACGRATIGLGRLAKRLNRPLDILLRSDHLRAQDVSVDGGGNSLRTVAGPLGPRPGKPAGAHNPNPPYLF